MLESSIKERGLLNTKRLHKYALYLSVFTVFYDFLEGVVSVVLGSFSGSVALVGFGLDSFVESLSGGVRVWRFTAGGKLSPAEEERVCGW